MAGRCLTKELDLEKFLFRQRLIITALLGLLKGHQTAFIDRLSRVRFLKYISKLDKTSSESDAADENVNYFIRKMHQSGSEVDKRLLAMFNQRFGKLWMKNDESSKKQTEEPLNFN